MKKQILGAAAILVLSAGAAFAAAGDPGTGVLLSVHDMTTKGATDAQGRVCAFCHSPHHATEVVNGPLWSRPANLNSYNPYASGTFQVANTTGYTNPTVGPTLLCLSCHDSNLAIDSHYAVAGGVNISAADAFGAGAAPNIGAAGLTNDHPVGFDYQSVVCVGAPFMNNNSDISGETITPNCKPYIRSAVNGLNASLTYINNPNFTVADRLYNGFMTCATCHDVHNRKNVFATADAGANYLVLAPQAGSALCLTCHIK